MNNPTPILANLRADLIKRRAEAGVSQSAVARAEGVETSAISWFERIGADYPRDIERRVKAYAEVCGFDPMEAWRKAVSCAA